MHCAMIPCDDTNKKLFVKMQKLSCETLQNFCRGCLQELKENKQFKISNLNLQIRHWLGDITLDNPLIHDIYPRSICQSCRNKFEKFVDFSITWEKSKRTVDELLATGDDKNIVSDEYVLKVEEPFESKNIDYTVGQNIQGVDNDSGEHIKHPNCPIEKDGIKKDYENKFQTEDLEEKIKIECSTKISAKPPKSKTDKKKYTYLFRCGQCKYRTISQQYLDIHMRTHNGLKPFQCPRCNDSFNKTAILLKHLKNTHGQNELKIICEHEQCGEEFNSSRSYKNHYRLNHLPSQSKKSLIKSPQRHVCEECGKVYKKLQTFTEHQYTHRSKDFYPFQCDVCDKAFVKRRTFNEHKLRHAGIKNFECPSCGAKRTTRKELRDHMNSHTRERQYPCPNCPMVFYRTSNRRVHVDVVHQGIRRFSCRYCDQTFGKGDNLKNHELLHTGEKPHVCSECKKRFVQKVSLRLHMKTHCK